MTSVIIPNSVTSIGEHAFDNCIALESIIVEEGNDVYDSRNNCNAIIETGTNKLLYGCKNTVIPNSVLTIGQSAFSGCSKLTSIDIPNSVTSIEEEAFDWCSDLISVTIGSGVTSIKNNAFAFCHKLEKVIVSDISAWCAISFENEDSNPLYHANHLYCDENTEITNLEIPSGVSSISKHAFQNCEGLRSLVIPNSVTSISEDAFTGCRNIVTMTINSSEISIVENVFMSCTSIADVFCYTEPEKVEWQGRFFPSKSFVKFHVFDKAPYETKFPNAGVTFCSFSGLCYEVISEIDKTAKVVEDTKKYKGDIEIASSCVIDGVTYSVIEIGNYAFYECGDLTSITIPHSVTSIGNSAFKGCGGLVSIKVENGNPKYDSRNDCNAIIETSSNKLILGSKNTVIPNSVTIIGSNAFRGCNGLTSVTIPNSVIFISDHAFEYCSDLSSITIGNSVDYIGTGIFNNCSNLTSIKVESGNLKYDSRDDCNAIIETSSNTLIKGCKGTIIPNSVTAIGNSAFEHNTGLTSMIIPNSVTSIGESAFYICGDLTSVSIPNSVTSIGSAAFCHCSRLTSITIPNSVTSIGDYAFDGCDGLTSVTVNMDQPVSISEGVFPNRANATLYVPAGSKAAYQAAAYWNDFKEIVEIGMDLPADELFSGTNLWAGYVAQEDLRPGTGLKVYVITNLGTTTATASQIDYMPQGVPVLLKRADTTVSSYEVTLGTGTAPTKNLLRVFNADRNVSNREGFILFNDEFVLVNEGVLPAGRVFLPANNLQMSRGITRSIVIDDDDATGIEDLEESPAVEEPYDVYDLSGRKVANQVTSLDGFPHGIYIVNGKKILKR